MDINPSLGSSLRVDMTSQHLHELQVRHQTIEAAQGCKGQKNKENTKVTAHHQTLVKLNDILHEHDDSKDTGKKYCMLCWEESLSGNSANAVAAK